LAPDGVNSFTRAALLRDGPPRDNGRVIWRGVVEARDATRAFFASEGKQDKQDQTSGSAYPPFCPEKFTSLSASEDSAVGRTTCFMDVGGGKLYWAAGCLDASAVVAGDGSDDAANCAATFASNPEVLACLEATKKKRKGESETGGLYTSRVVDRAPLDAATFQAALRETVGDARSDFEKNETDNDFSSAPVALLGDAAHPVIPSFGQGANLALEDAVELALALAHVDRRRAPRALREWERRRFERTKEAQIASFLSGSRSYGPEKLLLALEASGLSKEALRRHKETFPDANKTQDWLLAWKPSTEKTLPSVAPNRAMALARRAASAATPAGVGGVGDEFGDAGRDAGIKNVGAFLFFFGLQAALAAPPATAAPVSVAEEALIDFARSERDATAEKKTQTRFVGDGFAFDLPSGWRATDLPGVSVSKTSLTYDGLSLATAPEVTVTKQNEKNTSKFLVTREPTFTMGAAGLDSLYGSAEIFGARVAGARRGELSVARVSKSGDSFVAEGVEVGGDEDGKKTRWLELVACGCRGGENARKYNLLQTISVTGETADDAEFEGLRAIADSFQLTAGKTCGANGDERLSSE
jgi:2-polyprenyl-6-methoxyphenol hydroxylase-like FAD-dependent oxidoreductase